MTSRRKAPKKLQSFAAGVGRGMRREPKIPMLGQLRIAASTDKAAVLTGLTENS